MYNVVITGPMMSVGHTGKTRGETNEVIRFDCNQNIIRYLIENTNLVKSSHLVTYRGEHVSNELVELLDSITYVAAEDVENLALPTSSPLRPFNVHNTFKQYHLFNSIKVNIGPMEKTIKIRTDLQMPMSIIGKYYCSEKILLFGFTTDRPYQLHDFFHIGSYKNLKSFSEKMILNEAVQSEDVHYLQFQKFLKAEGGTFNSFFKKRFLFQKFNRLEVNDAKLVRWRGEYLNNTYLHKNRNMFEE